MKRWMMYTLLVIATAVPALAWAAEAPCPGCPDCPRPCPCPCEKR